MGVLVGALLTVMVVGCQGGNLMEEIAKAGATTAFDLLTKTGQDKLVATGYFTLFVPTNEAFAKVPQEIEDIISNNMTALARILEYHATSHIFRSTDAFNDLRLESRMGQLIWINVYRETDMSPKIVTAEGAKILQADIVASNGFLHVVDRVMLPPIGDLYALLRMSGELSTLKSLMDSVGLNNSLVNSQATLLAPTNDAFAGLEEAIGKAAMDAMVADRVMLKEILEYHLIQDIIYSPGAFNGTFRTKDIGTELMVETGADNVTYVNHAKVLLGDIPATNGVMHVLDKVLVPPRYATSIVGK